MSSIGSQGVHIIAVIAQKLASLCGRQGSKVCLSAVLLLLNPIASRHRGTVGSP